MDTRCQIYRVTEEALVALVNLNNAFRGLLTHFIILVYKAYVPIKTKETVFD